MTYHHVCNKSNTTGVACGAGTAYPSGVHEFNPGFNWGCVARSLVFCVVYKVICALDIPVLLEYCYI
jgi:hypothetical protein